MLGQLEVALEGLRLGRQFLLAGRGEGLGVGAVILLGRGVVGLYQLGPGLGIVRVRLGGGQRVLLGLTHHRLVVVTAPSAERVQQATAAHAGSHSEQDQASAHENGQGEVHAAHCGAPATAS